MVVYACASTTVFNHLYRDFREKSSLVSLYALEFLQTFLLSLGMSDRDESSLAAATAPAAARCCPYLLRIVAGTANVLNKPLDQRRSHQCLSSMVEWLFSECASVEAQFRLPN